MTVPIAIPDVSDAIGLALGPDELCVLRTGKPPRWWCSRPPNELHDGPRLPLVERVDLPVGTISPLTVRADGPRLGAEPRCVIARDRHVRCHEWKYEVAPDGTDVRTESDVDIEGVDRAVDIVDGGDHACALLDDGEVKCWGTDNYGQLGDGRTDIRCVRGIREPPSHVATPVRFDAPAPPKGEPSTFAPPAASIMAIGAFMPAEAPDECREYLHSNQHFADLFTQLYEPSLWIAASDPTLRTYRFTLNPTWAEPITVRVESRGSDARLTAARLSGAGGFGPGRIEFLEARRLTESEWTSVESCVTAAMRVEPYDRTLGCDGSEWLFESVRDGRYAARMRWSPRGDDANDPPLRAFVACAETMVTLAGLDPTRMEAKGDGP